MEDPESNSETKEPCNNNIIGNQLLINDSEVVMINENHSKNSPVYLTIEPLMFATIFADGLLGPVTTNFVIARSCEIHFGFNKSTCNELVTGSTNDTSLEALVQPYAALILTGMNFLSVFFPVIASLFLGAWSDHNGRKLLLIVPTIGFSLKYVLLAIFSWIPNLHPTFLFISVIPVALTGGFVNFITASYSYICDITNECNRSYRISVLEAVLFCGVIVGNVSSSPLYHAGGKYCYLLTFGVGAAIVFLMAIYSCYFVAESVRTTTQGKTGILHMFDINLLKEMFQVSFKRRENHGRAVIFLVIISLTNTISAMEGESNVRFLFTRMKYGWNIEKYTEWISVTHTINILGLLLGSFLLNKWLKMSDAIVGVISYLMHAAGDLFMALLPSSSPNLMYYLGLIKIFGGLCGPAGRALLSKNVPEEDLGKLFALTTSSESIFPLAVTPLYTLLYNSTLNSMPGAFFYLSVSFYLVNIIFYVIVYFIQGTNEKPRYREMNDENHVEE